ncbi:MAG: RNB domain-containing ribonuclease, partial [Burkholderiales bacterium]
RLGIHIAAPGLGISPESPAGLIARERLSTVYMPGNKITMLPDEVVRAYSLDAGTARPAISLYLDFDPATFAVRSSFSRVEQVPIAANLRHQQIESLNAVFEAGPDAPLPDLPYASELRTLHALAVVLATARGDTGSNHDRAEYMFYVVDDRIQITERKRGAPIDKLVAELMILVNRSWGKLLADNDVAAIYRAQAQGKVRMTTAAGEHQGLGVSHYAWSSSPLRRFVDLTNQWQLIALLDGATPPFARNSASLLGAIRDFELTYAAYGEFQDKMEHYWCLRWLVQEGVTETLATVVRESVVKFRDLPLYVRVPSLPPELQPGTGVQVAVTGVDLIDSTVEVVFKSRLGGDAPN